MDSTGNYLQLIVDYVGDDDCTLPSVLESIHLSFSELNSTESIESVELVENYF